MEGLENGQGWPPEVKVYGKAKPYICVPFQAWITCWVQQKTFADGVNKPPGQGVQIGQKEKETSVTKPASIWKQTGSVYTMMANHHFLTLAFLWQA